MDNLVFRPWQAGDETALVRHANNRKIWLNLRDRFPHPYTTDAAAAWIALTKEQGDPAINFAIVVDGESVGCVGLEPLTDVNRRTAEVGYWVGEDTGAKDWRPPRPSG